MERHLFVPEFADCCLRAEDRRIFTLSEITWRPGFGDRHPLAWCITVAYFLSGWVCLLAGKRDLKEAPKNGVLTHWQIWFAFAGLLFLLGINKQLDLQTLITQIGAAIARRDGWYQHRRYFQAAFIAVVASIGLASVVAGFVLLRNRRDQFGIAYTGLVCLLTFVIVRAASMHHIDVLLFHLPLIGNWMNFWLELGGVLLVASGALQNIRRTSDSGSCKAVYEVCSGKPPESCDKAVI